MATRAERAAAIKAIREMLLRELSDRIGVEPPAALDHDPLACELWKDEVDRTGQRLARGWGLEYQAPVNLT